MNFAVFEDFRIGETREYGDYEIDEAELLAFAAAYDPQPFHLDAGAAQDTILGGLAASGWQVCSALTRMMIDDWLGASSVLAGIGIEDNRWLAPVRAGDRLTALTTTVAKSDARSRRDAGIVTFATSLRDQTGREVMTQTASMLFGRRAPRQETDAATNAATDTATAPRRGPTPPPPEPIDDLVGAMPDDFARATVGAFAQLGETLFTAELIRDYALKYDPMPFHVDEAAGRAHMLGAMSAAGLHAASCWMSHFVTARERLGILQSRASPGFRDMRWRRPVLVGDRISFSTQIVAKRETSKAGLGLISSRNLGVNQRGEVAMEFYASVFSPISPAS